jgi:hypothetical protein
MVVGQREESEISESSGSWRNSEEEGDMARDINDEQHPVSLCHFRVGRGLQRAYRPTGNEAGRSTNHLIFL